MSNTTSNSQLTKFIIITVVAAVAIGGIALLRNRTTATINIAPTGQQAVVFTNKSERTLTDPEATTTYAVQAGDVEVIVSAENRYPWRETITTTTGSSTLIKPFLVPEQPRTLRNVPGAVQEQLSSERTNPTVSATSSDQNTRIIVNENDRVIAEWIGPRAEMPAYYSCQEASNRCGVEVYGQDGESVEQVSFYPNRSDVVLFATQSGVYAIEIDPTGKTQNFQPVNDTLQTPHFFATQDRIFVGNENQITVTQL